MNDTAEKKRLDGAHDQKIPWRGPYLSERQRGTVREGGNREIGMRPEDAYAPLR